MTKEEFYSLPGIAVNPLRDQLFNSLELTDTRTIAFAEFAKFVQVFSYSSSQDAKLKGFVLTSLENLADTDRPASVAFKIHDFDSDGKISRDDLRAYCSLVFPRAESDGDSAANAQQEVIHFSFTKNCTHFM
ncbi:hypothetical protein V7S43_006622 [Phytophthora oleae]|uniref:EF-hand domain-containing protein n=1 Tax=Phytophthora oleae TaxID=2107226 RepID=A0ABD3FU69_9STRA